ncbi:hypothetical protein GCM10027589_15500 [Actinocorallia lasiicapitis]
MFPASGPRGRRRGLDLWLFGRGRLGPQVELGAVLLEALPDGKAAETEDGEHEKLLHGEDPFTSDKWTVTTLAMAWIGTVPLRALCGLS